MPEADATEQQAVPRGRRRSENHAFFLKGSGAYDWGMQHRLARIFRPESGRTVMLAIDHGYFQGPTTGLERVDLNIVPLVPYADALMLHPRDPALGRPADDPAGLRPARERRPEHPQGALQRADRDGHRGRRPPRRRGDGGPGVHRRRVRDAVGPQHDPPGRRRATGYGIPVLGVTAVGKELVRDARYLGLATRICAELGAQVVKTYYCDEDFEQVTAGCPVPIVMAGGKKLPELDALTMAYRAIERGAAGVDMGRNIFQSEAPIAMIQAVRKVVHEGCTPAQAFEVYRDAPARVRARRSRPASPRPTGEPPTRDGRPRRLEAAACGRAARTSRSGCSPPTCSASATSSPARAGRRRARPRRRHGRRLLPDADGRPAGRQGDADAAPQGRPPDDRRPAVEGRRVRRGGRRPDHVPGRGGAAAASGPPGARRGRPTPTTRPAASSAASRSTRARRSARSSRSSTRSTTCWCSPSTRAGAGRRSSRRPRAGSKRPARLIEASGGRILLGVDGGVTRDNVAARRRARRRHHRQRQRHLRRVGGRRERGVHARPGPVRRPVQSPMVPVGTGAG